MKKINTYIIAFSTMVLAGSVSVTAQTVAIGHATAEVVESVSASSQAITFLSLGVQTANDETSVSSSTVSSQTSRTPKVSALTTRNYENINLGEFRIGSSNNSVCDVIVNQAVLKDSNGNDITVETIAKTHKRTDVEHNSVNGKTLSLTGNVCLEQRQTGGIYSGSYKMIIAYN